MCGIVGVLQLDGAPLGTEATLTLREMASRIGYRGPDDEQILVDGPLGLAFRRLSIVDVEGGRQPMLNEDESLLLVVNGEIYNHQELKASLPNSHRFRSRSDSEVVLHLYEDLGLRFLEKLNGMYGLALWDRRQRRLILARDRLGIKPLYYAFTKGLLLFGSEIKALLAHPSCPREFDWATVLTDPFMKQSVFSTNDPISNFKGIEYLPAGNRLVFELDRKARDEKPYWRLTLPPEEEYSADQRSELEIIEGYGALLEDSTSKCLMGDVEFGVFLSGGIDSVAISAIAASESQFHTFSVLSQSTFTTGDAEAAHRASNELDLINHQVLFDWHADHFSPEQWKRLLWICETPYCGPEQLYKYQLHRFAKATRPGLKIILLGQGSDEFNGGYSRYSVPENQSWAEFLSRIGYTYKEVFLTRREGALRFLDSALGRPIFRDSFLASVSKHATHRSLWHAYVDAHLKALQMYNLWHEDRTAAANSIENRVPFLDHRLVEYVANVPPKLRESLFWDKRILREAMRTRVPAGFYTRPKVPFFIGKDLRYTRRMMVKILLADEKALVREAFAGEGSAGEIFDIRAMEGSLDQIAQDPESNGLELFLTLTNMGLLEKAALNAETRRAETANPPLLSSISVHDWAEEQESLALRLGTRRTTLDLDRVVSFAPNTFLVKPDGVTSDGESFVMVDDQLMYCLTEEEVGVWLEVLRKIDGKRTLREILMDTNVSEADIRKHLEEALDFEILRFDDS